MPETATLADYVEWMEQFTLSVLRPEPRVSQRRGSSIGSTIEATRMRIRHLPLETGSQSELTLKAAHQQVYATLLAFSSDLTGESAIALVELGRVVALTGLSERTVSRLISDLAAVGFLARRKCKNQRSVTTLWRNPGHLPYEARTR